MWCLISKIGSVKRIVKHLSCSYPVSQIRLLHLSDISYISSILLLQMHQSILLVSENPLLPQCTSCCTMYHCSLCPALKPTTLKKIKQHWEVHLKKAIVFQGKFVTLFYWSCSLLIEAQTRDNYP